MRSSNDCSTQSNKRSSVFRQSGENINTPQTNEKRSVLLPLKRVFSTVLGDVTNTVHSTPTELQSGIFNHIRSVERQTESSRVNLSNSTRPSNTQTQPNLNNSGLTWQSYEGHSSRNDSSTSNKRRCADIRPTNLFKAFSISESTEKHTATTSSPRGQQGFLDETNIEADSENLCPFEDQGFQIYDISSEEEETNYEDHSDYETTTLPQEEISVQTVQDDERAQVLKMATIFQNIFQDKPMKKGWTKSKRPGRKARVKAEFSANKSESGSAPSSSFVSEAPLLLQDNEPNEAASTPSSKRKNEENKDTPDKTSTSKKLCTKVIKKEKK
ncbi:hypothetical protein F2Q69_00031640 [Brassica cretica]|uniref:Uncharacterized protein n=1 Tax=Brassica cretica TaxID=69181 RepID=A0A8S9RY97_BRACR|nr:hypothetical protein F2Q69_00031640 [Brassica cretica]